MILDFTNYTFSGLLSLLSAILGIGYPLFLESVRKIDDQYESSRLSAKFQREKVFLGYRVSLLLSIVVSFAAPFLMLLLQIDVLSILIVTVQAIVLLWLVFEMLLMFQVIQEYYNPSKLFERIHIPSPLLDSDDEGQRELLCLIDLTRYAAKRENEETYFKCKSAILHITNQEEMQSKDHPPYNVSQGVFSAFRQVAKYSKDTSLTYLANDNLAGQAFYNYYLDYQIGPQTYKLLWQQACVVAEGGSEEWFRQLWSYAVQFYVFRLESKLPRNDESLQLFLEQHFMLGVLSMFYERYDWLSIILFHTQVHPPKYPLVPSSFVEIVDTLNILEKQRDKIWRLTEKYQMKGLFADVNSDDKLLDQAYRYAALLIIRLFSVDDYNITYSDPMQIPHVDPNASILDLRYMLRLANRLKWHAQQWYDKDTVKHTSLPVLPDFNDVSALLDQYISAIEAQMQYNQAHPVLDAAKMEELKGLLAEADAQKPISIPSHAEGAYADVPLTISTRQKMDNETTAVGGYPGWSNFPSVLVSVLNHKIDTYYDGLFVFIPSEIFTISDKNVFKALEMLCPQNNEVILALGIYMSNYDMIYNDSPKLRYEGNRMFFKETEIISRTSDQSSLIIIRRDMMPTITFLPPSDEMQRFSMVELPGVASHLSTNIDKVIEDNLPAPVVLLGRNVQSHIPEGAKAIRIVVNRNCDDTMEMERLSQYRATAPTS